jgi:hypothetical protein
MAWWNIELWPRNPGGDQMPLKRPRWMPKPYWQRVLWARIGSLLSWAAAMMIWLWARRSWPWTLLFSWALLLVATVIWTAWPRIAFSRMKARLLEHDYLLCLSCGSSLKSLPARHMYPECGWAHGPTPSLRGPVVTEQVPRTKQAPQTPSSGTTWSGPDAGRDSCAEPENKLTVFSGRQYCNKMSGAFLFRHNSAI